MEFDADDEQMGDTPPPPGYDPGNHTVAEIEALAPGLSEYDLHHGIIAEVLGKNRKTALAALRDAYAEIIG